MKNKCTKGSCGKPLPQNGKGDSPRNNFSKKFKENFESINWKKKKK
jgi:hypothetical protein